MVEEIVSLIRKAVSEIVSINGTADIYSYYQYLERLTNKFINLYDYQCQATIPEDFLQEMDKALPAQSVLRAMENRLTELLANLFLDGLLVVSYPSQKSKFAIYEKIIDKRMARSTSPNLSEKRKRAIHFKQVLNKIESKERLVNLFKDLVRARLVFTTPKALALACPVIESEIYKAGFVLNEIRYINVNQTEGGLIFPNQLDSQDYVAVHFKMSGTQEFICGTELQVRVAQNHWGPHMLAVVNGYLNKYMSATAEEIDYSVDRLGLGNQNI